MTKDARMKPPSHGLGEAQCSGDDWSGLKDPKERRRIQNRLNVRAHRRRKATETIRQVVGEMGSLVTIVETPGSSPPARPWLCRAVGVPQSLEDSANGQGTTKPGTKIMEHSEAPALESPPRMALAETGTAKHDRLFFPLTLDHLIPLVQFNVMRALCTNMGLLSPWLTFDDECDAAWAGLPTFPAPLAQAIPPALQPTTVQLSTPHDAWLALAPDTQLRDNTILAVAQGRLDLDELTIDVTGCGGSGGGLALTGVLVWTTPWNIQGWEMTEGFAKKYGATLLRGCDEFVRATNHWRAQRGEEPLVVEELG
ncbi:hypothetical protein GQ53DRAFT_742282 [Thozetella sp. PMI_491]|nr:hypothetical protein GQ53DRAFT_742282 [Thozetella sp. PMI_491]